MPKFQEGVNKLLVFITKFSEFLGRGVIKVEVQGGQLPLDPPFAHLCFNLIYETKNIAIGIYRELGLLITQLIS